MAQLFLLLITLPILLPSSFLEVSASSSTFRSRSILRDIGGESGEVHDYAVDVNVTNFDSVLHDTPATYAIVEFFAHWCPACRNYKPQYEKVARLFNGPSSAHPGLVLMTRVDCALKINTKLCDKFEVDHYPKLFWGPPSKFVAGSAKQDKIETISVDDFRTASRLLNWINKQIGSSYTLDDQKFENVHPSNISDFGEIARAVFDVEEATSTAFDIILDHKMIKSETKASLTKFLQLLVVHHPSKRCRKGTADILVNFKELFSSDTLAHDKQEDGVDDKTGSLENLQICGKQVPRGYWVFCHGSKNDTRGFSCGLWVLLHSLSVRIEDGESQIAFTAICDFIRNFFICEECRQHFSKMCSSVSTPFESTRDLALWLWSAHNQVNKRLMKEEESLGTGDPKFPKTIWPPKQLCSSCSGINDEDWNQEEVFKFLTGYYGTTLVSLNKDKAIETRATSKALEDTASASTNAVVVPLGAALAIALASCAFGALACYWRSQQKNRKLRRSWN